MLRSGYKLPFKTIPSHVELKNNKSSLDNSVIVNNEIEKLLKKGCITKFEDIPSVVNPLTVAFNKSNKPRLVLDCRHINLHLFKYKVKFEDQSVARDLFSNGYFLFSFDLKSAYHHIEIFELHRTFLGFSWVIDGVKTYYISNVRYFCSRGNIYQSTSLCGKVMDVAGL